MLSATVERHIALHHATGYLFRKQSILLRNYARYAEAQGDDVVRSATALAWAALAPRRARATAGSRSFAALRRGVRARRPTHAEVDRRGGARTVPESKSSLATV
jgi:hypothetical protein